jgi:hypothetical protein
MRINSRTVVFTSLLVENAVRNIGDKWAVIFETHYKEYLHLLRSNDTNLKFAQDLLENGYTIGKMYDIMEIMYFTKEEHIWTLQESFSYI